LKVVAIAFAVALWLLGNHVAATNETPVKGTAPPTPINICPKFISLPRQTDRQTDRLYNLGGLKIADTRKEIIVNKFNDDSAHTTNIVTPTSNSTLTLGQVTPRW
jgi:hypothetical protein